MQRQVVIIGGGSGGYPSALLLAQKGCEVTLIERDRLGGTCLNRGCIPTKLFLHASKLIRQIRTGKRFGLQAEGVKLDIPRFLQHKAKVISGLVNGVEKLCNMRKVKIVKGTAFFEKPHKIRIKETGEEIDADAVIIATGSNTGSMPISGINGRAVLTSDQALLMEKIPPSIIIIGGGYIGLEFAQIYQALGSKVTVLEMLPNIIANEDSDIVLEMTGILRNQGIQIINNACVKEISDRKGRKSVRYTENGKERNLEGDCVLVAVGRIPNTAALNLQGIGIKQEKGYISVDSYMESSVPGVYAIGDVVGGVMMAHVATAEGGVAVDNIMGQKSSMDYTATPRCIYTDPEVASVGLTEAQAKEIYGQINVGLFPLKFSGKAQILDGLGFAKVISEKDLNRIVGLHLIGPNATEIIAEGVLALNLECTVEELAHTIHPHPTISEAIMEAAMSIEGFKVNSI